MSSHLFNFKMITTNVHIVYRTLYIASRPLTTAELCSKTAMTAVQQARLHASANTCRCTASSFVMFLTMVLGMVTFFNCFVHLVHSFLRGSDISVVHPFFSSHASLYIRFSSTVVGDNTLRGSYILPRWLRIVFLVTRFSAVKRHLVNSNVLFSLSQLSPSILLGLVIPSLSSSQRLDSHL